MDLRCEQVTEVGAALVRRGYHIFCPIAQNHPMTKYGLPGGWDFWGEYDTIMVGVCKDVWILTLDGWRESVGVKHEAQLAWRSIKPVYTIDRLNVLSSFPLILCPLTPNDLR